MFQRIKLHIKCAIVRPSNIRFYSRGIARELTLAIYANGQAISTVIQLLN